MNILQLTDYLPDYTGNFGETLIEITKKIKSTGGQCFISFPVKRKWHEKLLDCGGHVIYLPVFKFKEKKIDFNSVKILNNLIKNENIDVVHVHFGLSQKVTTFFLKLINPKVKIVWHWRGDIKNMTILKYILTFIFYRFIEMSVKAHITNSPYITKRLINSRIVNSRKIYTLPNAINIYLFDKNKYINKIQKLHLKYNTREIFTIIMIRNFRKAVDFKIILDVMEKLQLDKVNIQLLWIGYGETEDYIKFEIKRININNIKLLGKIDNPVSYYYISKINIIAWEPWCKETINNTVYEALMCGIPIVGLNFGGLPETFDESEGVFTVPLNSIKYAQKIIEIRNNYADINARVTRGREKVIKMFSLEQYVQKLISIYNS